MKKETQIKKLFQKIMQIENAKHALLITVSESHEDDLVLKIHQKGCSETQIMFILDMAYHKQLKIMKEQNHGNPTSQ